MKKVFLFLVCSSLLIISQLFAQSKSADKAFDNLDKEEQSVNTAKTAPAKPAVVSPSKQTTTVPVQAGLPQRIYIVHDYVTTVLDYNTYGVISEFPSEFKVSVWKNLLYDIGTGTVGLFDWNSGKNIGDIWYGGQPIQRKFRSKITLDGKKMYIGAPQWKAVEEYGVFVIDLIGKKLTKVIEKDLDVGIIDLSNDGKYLYVPHGEAVRVINTSDESFYKTINLEKNERIQDLVSSSSYKIYIVTYKYNSGEMNAYKFKVIDLNKGVVKIINLSSQNNKGYKILPDINHKSVYVAGDNELLKIQADDFTILYKKEFKYWVNPSAISPDGKFLFVQPVNENKVSIYDIEKQSVIKEIPFKEDLYDILVE